MFIKSTALTALTLLSLKAGSVSAQNATAEEINGVVANYEGAQLVPQFLPTLEPQGVLLVAFNGTNINLGDALPQDTVGAFPNLQVSPYTGSEAWGFGEDYMYTALMADADIVGTDEGGEQTFHWLANGLTLGSSSTDPPFSFNLSTSTTIINYAGPGPAAGSGPHRYVILLIRQYPNFTAPSDLSSPDTPLGTHSTSQYLSTEGLGDVVATSYFTVENGEATVSVGSTSAVDSATLASTLAMGSASMTGSMTGSMSGSMSGSMTGTASRTGSASSTATTAAASSTGAALGNAAGLGGNWAVVGVTMVGVVVGALMI